MPISAVHGVAAWLLTLMVIAGAPLSPASAQPSQRTEPDVLDEVIVTAARVERNLQQTPLSVRAFTGEEFGIAGIDNCPTLGASPR